MICCKCGQEIRNEEKRPMILKGSTDFNRYPIGDYFCCPECDKVWQQIKKQLFRKTQLSKNFTDHDTWLYLFFEYFLDENPSRRRLI